MKHTHGFTLIELAIVLVIIGLLLGGLLAPLATQVEIEHRKQTQAAVKDAIEALIGFAIVNGRLPCPAAGANGIAALSCANTPPAIPPAYTVFPSGRFPWQTLGLSSSGLDSWGQTLRYTVNGAFTLSAPNQFTLNTLTTIPLANQLHVCATAPPCIAPELATNVPAVVFSTGKNWANAPSADETENADGDNYFVSRTYNTNPGNEFDDIIDWLSPNILFNRMVMANRLP